MTSGCAQPRGKGDPRGGLYPATPGGMQDKSRDTLEIDIDTNEFGSALALVEASERPTLPAPEESQRLAKKSGEWTDVEGPSTKLFAIQSEIPSAPLDSIPVPVVAQEDLAWFELSEAALSVLSDIDGGHTVEELMATVDASPEELLVAIGELVDKEIVRLD
jgi:hypothetical protein